ncbi:hypothetical protein AVEN_4940-1 [Araneus ventricosus]|uniref:Uncharacterized protein n=1 Tax=Araneus ventricosus TaxID=182803 RepID=A0A4Y2E622_ARAVE|nr:hypothetical protein AVEN_4940-1 [Araneus ventricosus]
MNESAAGIQRQLVEVCEESVMSRQSVANWCTGSRTMSHCARTVGTADIKTDDESVGGTGESSSSDYYLFPVLKRHFGGHRFQSDEDVKKKRCNAR